MFRAVHVDNKPSAERLSELYLRQCFCVREIAAIFGVSNATTIRWMKQYGIPRRTLQEARVLAFIKHPESKEKMSIAAKKRDCTRISQIGAANFRKHHKKASRMGGRAQAKKSRENTMTITRPCACCSIPITRRAYASKSDIFVHRGSCWAKWIAITRIKTPANINMPEWLTNEEREAFLKSHKVERG